MSVLLEEPELITLIPEEEPEEPPPPPKLGAKIVVNLIVIAGLKVATGFAVRSLVKNIRQFDILYPEHLDRIRWKDMP